MLFGIYKYATVVFGPLINLYLLYRRKKGKEDPVRYRERLGYASSPRPAGCVVWVHAASVGESLSVLPLVQQLCERFPEIHVLITTGTVTSADLIAKRLPDRAFHQFNPVDKLSAVRHFLSHWRPNVALWVESELWPISVSETSRQCPMVLINGRMSERSFAMWQKWPRLACHMVSKFSLILPQSETDAERYKTFHARKVKYIGNIKFDAAPLPSDPQKAGELINIIGDRPVWLAASTHSGEEIAIAKTHQYVQRKIKDVLTIIVPRHASRGEDIQKDINDYDNHIALRSVKDSFTKDTNIYIADTMGELGIFYRLASVVFVGGSLVPHGGQNPLEPARLECGIVFGPHMENFEQIQNELLDAHGAVRIEDGEQLPDVIQELLSDRSKQDKLAQNAEKVVESKNGIIRQNIDEISPFVDKALNKN